MAVAAAIALAAPASAHQTHAHSHTHGHQAVAQEVVQTPTVVVSCFRGPWDKVIWDHPQAPFTDSLVAYGYSFERANAIAQRVCRDATLVGRPEALRATTMQILRTAPRN
ncbi:hypothetical protein PARPLA_01344 [Rhodobacteraceae bacterium THAF1]|nr:hypothetical protein FIU81_12380 [Palleronia sp. THAF1]VDC21847.1 hypothetical protein PARPLA_01344 [Rhodobacteraceae bacterium THAF1]